MKHLLLLIVISLIVACASSTPSTPVPVPTVPDHQIFGTSGQVRFIIVPKGTTKSNLQAIANAVCSGSDICIIHFWDDRNLAAGALPMSDDQLQARIAQYNLNKNTGLNRLIVCKDGGC